MKLKVSKYGLSATAFLVGLSWISSSGWAEPFADTIILKGGSAFPEKVGVIKETFKEVTFYNDHLPKQSQPYERLEKIIHGDEPREFQQGTTRMGRSRFEEAIRDFQKAELEYESGKVREWIRQYSPFYLARCHQALAKYQEAIESYTLLLKRYPETIFLPQVYEGVGQCYQGLGGEANYGEAVKAFRKLPEFGVEWSLRAQRGEAQILEAKKSYDQAADKYREIIKQAGTDKPAQFQGVVNLAYDGLGRSLLRVEKVKEAIQTYNELRGVAEKVKVVKGVPEKAYREGMAVACNGLGDCMFKLLRYEDAVLQYLRVPILYPEEDPEESQTQTARAVLQSAKCFEQLARQPGIPKDKKKTWEDRHRELLDEVVGKYPQSPSGKEAKSLLKGP